MEVMNEDGFLEELLALRREAWESNPSTEINGLFSTTSWPFDGLDSTPPPAPPPQQPPSYDSFSSSIIEPTTLDCSSFPDFYSGGPLLQPTTAQTNFPGPAQYPLGEQLDGYGHVQGTCKPEPMGSTGEVQPAVEVSSFNMGLCMERSNKSSPSSNNNNNKNKVKKIEGQPSKNLMAERRRRKRLNDRLSMLRSVVPKISKMDRTSILGDTIDYMKELLERINNLQEGNDHLGPNQQLNVISLFKDVKPNDVLVRNSPKFDVERREVDTRVEICCAAKPGLLLSTVTALEALGLEIQQCVISCFNDFSLQASCSEEMEQRTLINSEEIKQALFRNAGYGGRCL